jgi:polyhydroxyalkanoate synthase
MSPVWRRVAQAYLVAREELLGTVDDLDLDEKSADRARFALMQVTEAAAPSNNLLTNPTALKRAADTRGQSLVDGVRHLAHDLRHNGGMPSQVDTRPFEVGRTLALSPGGVVERTELYELLQYEPTTPRVRRRPVVIIPPQVNKYYFLDLVPGRSFIEHAVAQGLQVFVLSWRNPGPDQRDWSLETYVSACLQAVETTTAITRSPDVTVVGFCAGGITQSLMLGHLAAVGEPLVHASTLAVTSVDSEAKSVMNMFVSERTAASSIERSRRKGILEGRSLSRVFAWVRPNDLVWNYVVSNYLMGQNPPAFDVLAWNGDSTNLPAALHAEFVHLGLENGLMHPNRAEVLGTPIDLSKVTTDLYVVGAMTDHLVPWEAAYAATQVYGGDSRFVLSNSGHIQALINPPGNPKASFFASDEHPPSPEEWLAGATRETGSWWTDWAAWTIARSGTERSAPSELGDRDHPVLAPAPGTYVKAPAEG